MLIEVLTFMRRDDGTRHEKVSSKRTEDIALEAQQLVERKNDEWPEPCLTEHAVGLIKQHRIIRQL